MCMKPEHAARLQQLLTLTDLSPRSHLILARRVARYICTERLLSEGSAEIEKTETGLPSTRGQLAKIKQIQHDAAELHRKTLADIGTWLCQNEEALTAQYGFAGLCDVLEVNRVHRAQVIEGAKDVRRGISAIVFIWALEDSASGQSGRHPAECKDGPLYQALWEAVKQLHSGQCFPDVWSPSHPTES